MKNFLFFLACSLFFFGKINAQSAPAVSQEAKDLVANVRESASEVDSAISKISALRDKAERENNRKFHRFFGDGAALATDLKSFGERVLRAGENMPAAKLNGFKAESARFDKKLETWLANQPPSATGISFNECCKNCHDIFPKWWQVVRRTLCKVLCLFP